MGILIFTSLISNKAKHFISYVIASSVNKSLIKLKKNKHTLRPWELPINIGWTCILKCYSEIEKIREESCIQSVGWNPSPAMCYLCELGQVF